MEDRVYKNREIRITDLVLPAPRKGHPDLSPVSVLHELVFEDCQIVGPAVLASHGNTQWRNPTFESPDVFMEFEAPPETQLFGVVFVENCLFENCTFTNIGIVGPPELIARFRAAETD